MHTGGVIRDVSLTENYVAGRLGQAPAKPRAKKKGGEDLPADVEAAIQAVDAAAAKLPSEDALNYSVMAADGGGGWNQRASDKPPNPGSKVCCARPH